jgi:hypothetical protein
LFLAGRTARDLVAWSLGTKDAAIWVDMEVARVRWRGEDSR